KRWSPKRRRKTPRPAACPVAWAAWAAWAWTCKSCPSLSRSNRKGHREVALFLCSSPEAKRPSRSRPDDPRLVLPPPGAQNLVTHPPFPSWSDDMQLRSLMSVLSLATAAALLPAAAAHAATSADNGYCASTGGTLTKVHPYGNTNADA